MAALSIQQKQINILSGESTMTLGLKVFQQILFKCNVHLYGRWLIKGSQAHKETRQYEQEAAETTTKGNKELKR